MLNYLIGLTTLVTFALRRRSERGGGDAVGSLLMVVGAVAVAGLIAAGLYVFAQSQLSKLP